MSGFKLLSIARDSCPWTSAHVAANFLAFGTLVKESVALHSCIHIPLIPGLLPVIPWAAGRHLTSSVLHLSHSRWGVPRLSCRNIQVHSRTTTLDKMVPSTPSSALFHPTNAARRDSPSTYEGAQLTITAWPPSAKGYVTYDGLINVR